ncbi:MAG TPA: HAD-IIIA family hydrolase [Candidatus Omnitrophota bacterium]|nr:HAD-IIIA family hydrolase [Candidatus Omnitrophota bacterium]HPT06791.1 HAD-IIIA family hydrolase [Candidatus Omnitrophota bacterium]
MNPDIVLAKAKKIKLFLFDVDGVLTDGRIIYDSGGRDMKFFDVHDGLGVHLLHKAGIPAILVTAKSSRAISPRARDMHVAEIFANIVPKSAVLEKIVKKFAVSLEEIAFVGDDLVDLPLMSRVGLPVAVLNACDEVKAKAAYVTAKRGGRGAVREVVELVLKSQGVWEKLVGDYDV